jgi:AcrR family transcriptional regulator
MSEASIWTRRRTVAATGRPAQRRRADIVAAAIAVAAADGLAAMTMRRVAGELGTGAASLYRHLDTRDDLVDLMIDDVLEQYQSPPILGAPVEDVVADLMARLRFVRAHPWLIDAFEERPELSPQRIRLVELSLERLAQHPADGPTKLEAVTVAAGMLHTQLRHERSGGALDPQVAQAQIELLHRAAADGDHPRLAEVLSRPTDTAVSSDSRFTGVLGRTLEGLLSTAT